MLFTLALHAVLQAPAQLPPAVAYVPPRTREAITRDSLEAAELRFFYEWNDAYALSQDYRAGFSFWTLRQMMIECTIFKDRKNGAKVVAWQGRIVSTHNSFSVCPTWTLSDSIPHDERVEMDQALDARFHASVRAARASLIGIFATATAAFPRNEWMVGQYVRLLIDQRTLGPALEAARRCGASATLCAELLGLVLVERGDLAAADSVFTVAMRSMSAERRCAWSDASVLLDSAARAEYRALSCAQRDAANTKLWWLADPLWTERGNERRAVHYARVVALELRTALNKDERWSWHPELGGDALREMVVRYGWPSFTFWAGLLNDRARTGRYLVPLFRGSVNPPYTTFEYTPGRMQTLPPWRLMAYPFIAKSSDWELARVARPPVNELPDTNLAQGANRPTSSMVTHDVVDLTENWWWPTNHFIPRSPILPLSDGERVFLRRQTDAIVGMLIEPATDSLKRAPNTPVAFTLVATSQPDSIRTVMQQRATAGTTVTLFGNIDARPTLLGVEMLADSIARLPAARSRFGVTPPEPLSALKSNERALSDLVIMRATDAAELPTSSDAALSMMRSSRIAAGTQRFSVYWESYGFAATDTVDVTVWVERYTSQGILRNLGIALNIARDRNTPVVYSWTEHGLGRNAHVINGPVTIVGRSVVVDASALETGDYWLSVVVRKPGATAVQSRRSFSIQR